MYPLSMLFLKLIAAHCVIKEVLKLENWRDIWQFAGIELSIFAKKRVSTSWDNVLTNLTRFVSFRQTIKNSLTTRSFSNFDLSVRKMKNSRIPKQQHGLENAFQFLHQFRTTWCKNLFSSAMLILVTWYHLSLMRWRFCLRKVKFKWNRISLKMKSQQQVELHVSKKQ